MQGIDIPDDAIVPLDTLAPRVVGLRVLFVNVFAVESELGWTLIDAALYGSATRIKRWARDHFGDRPPEAIFLTHAHFDHVGALDSLLGEWNVPVYAQRDELPYATGEREYPPPDPSVGVQRLSALQPDIAPAHGQAMAGGAATQALRVLAARFDERARPSHGKYAEHPVR